MGRKRIASIAAAASRGCADDCGRRHVAHAEGSRRRRRRPAGDPRTEHANDLDLRAGEVCPFKTTIVDIVNQTTTLVFPNGESRGTGRLVERITNVDTGKTVTRNISGPGASTYGPNGEWILTLTVLDLLGVRRNGRYGDCRQGLFIGHGPLVYVDLILVQAPPTYENLCETVG
jgi:hypothetical protein